jgi:hypothetical protein
LIWHSRACTGHARASSIGREIEAEEESMRRIARLVSERGQGTVEYVGLILLVALLMVGMVAAMKGFQGAQGLELAETIVDKIRGAVNKVTCR